MFIKSLLARLVRVGNLTLIDHKGQVSKLGDGLGPPVTMRLTSSSIARKLLINPGLYMPEGYLDGDFLLEEGSIFDFLMLLQSNQGIGGGRGKAYKLNKRFLNLIRAIHQFNPISRAAENARRHYDLNIDMYRLFLDDDLQYSCAYFENEDDSLEAAQYQKKRHIAAKLMIEPGMRVLDIGCGWGGMALFLAGECGASVTGVTLSPEQASIASERAAKAGLVDKIDIRVQDYRATEGPFDRIVSVGMLEHVGARHFPEYFQGVRDLLSEEGIALIHTIARHDGPSSTNAFIRKYIFPGGYSPALSEVIPAIEGTGMFITDIEILRRHYALTCGHWRRRFAANREKAVAMYDERFCRMWEFYLATSEIVFEKGNHIVVQVQLSRQKQQVPQTRDYIARWEAAHELAGAK